MGNGIVSGFLSGASQGMADAGKMMFAKQLSDESHEANSLRDRALRKDIQNDQQEFTSSEREANQEFTSSERESKQASDSKEKALDRSAKKSIEASKASSAAAKDGSTTKMKEVRDIMANTDKTFNEALGLVYPGAQIQYTNEEGERMVVVTSDDGFTELGRFATDQSGRGEFLNAGEDFENAEVTSKHRKSAEKITNDKAGWMSGDAKDFSETGGDRKAFKRQKAQELANQERAASKGNASKKGIINRASSPQNVAEQKGLSKSVSADAYKAAMKKKFKDIPDDVLAKKLAAAIKSGKVK